MADFIDKTRQTLIFNPIYHAYAGAAFALLQARFATIRFISAIPLFQFIIFKADRVWPEIFLGKISISDGETHCKYGMFQFIHF
ncbi:hypothetical protein [Xenorhabdus sp. SGI240]|uniref:hypothetical protein n=1 Tax=Xenorhabdus sp. SGI240 TaxID=3158262 RepID=UPI0032B81F34